MRYDVRHWMCALALYLQMRTRLTAQIVCELHFCPTAGKRVSPPLPPSPTPGTWGRGSVSTCTCSSRWPLASGCNICRSAWWPWLHLRCQTWRPRAPVWSLTEAEKKTSKQKKWYRIKQFFFVCARLYALMFWYFFFLLHSHFFSSKTKDHSLEKARLNQKEMSRWSEGFFFFFSSLLIHLCVTELKWTAVIIVAFQLSAGEMCLTPEEILGNPFFLSSLFLNHLIVIIVI